MKFLNVIGIPLGIAVGLVLAVPVLLLFEVVGPQVFRNQTLIGVFLGGILAAVGAIGAQLISVWESGEKSKFEQKYQAEALMFQVYLRLVRIADEAVKAHNGLIEVRTGQTVTFDRWYGSILVDPISINRAPVGHFSQEQFTIQELSVVMRYRLYSFAAQLEDINRFVIQLNGRLRHYGATFDKYEEYLKNNGSMASSGQGGISVSKSEAITGLVRQSEEIIAFIRDSLTDYDPMLWELVDFLNQEFSAGISVNIDKFTDHLKQANPKAISTPMPWPVGSK